MRTTLADLLDEESPIECPGSRIVCRSCGSEQEAPTATGQRCVICSRPLLSGLHDLGATPGSPTVASPAAILPEQEPDAVPFAEISLVLANDKRVSSALCAISIAVIVMVLLFAWRLVPSAPERAAELRMRIDSQIGVLGEMVDEYRRQSGALPDAERWRQSAVSGDLRFYDPWGRIYRYESTADEFSIATLGRDDVAGGRGEDEDIRRSFSPGSDLASMGASQRSQ